MFMSEKEPRKEEIINFHFICPEGREEEARELLGQTRGVSLAPDPSPETSVLVDPDTLGVTQNKGIGMIGTAPENVFMDVLQILSRAGIAGYSRETQVVKLKPPKNAN